MTGVAVLAALALPMVAGAANKLVVNGTDGTTPKMVVTDTGYVGVGTSVPNYPITIKGNTVTGSTVILSYDGNATYNRYADPEMKFSRNNDSSQNGGLPLNGDRLGFFTFGTNINSTYYQSAGIYAEAAENFGASTHAGNMYFATALPNQTYVDPKMTLTALGNVGVGTTSPSQKLEVRGGVRLNTPVAKATCDSTLRGTIWFTQGGSGVADTLEVCAKDSAGNYSWRALF